MDATSVKKKKPYDYALHDNKTLSNYYAYEKVIEYKVTTQNEMNIGGLPPTKRFVYSLSLTFSACFIQV